eukprot:c11712_g1_i1.p1 GENE.c11712_g1_i1~~c11712_g1_i1.p1  ORF type:complete len:343 (+),score=86.79 c11712_g1_i1:55-1029(+)
MANRNARFEIKLEKKARVSGKWQERICRVEENQLIFIKEGQETLCSRYVFKPNSIFKESKDKENRPTLEISSEDGFNNILLRFPDEYRRRELLDESKPITKSLQNDKPLTRNETKVSIDENLEATTKSDVDEKKKNKVKSFSKLKPILLILLPLITLFLVAVLTSGYDHESFIWNKAFQKWQKVTKFFGVEKWGIENGETGLAILLLLVLPILILILIRFLRNKYLQSQKRNFEKLNEEELNIIESGNNNDNNKSKNKNNDDSKKKKQNFQKRVEEIGEDSCFLWTVYITVFLGLMIVICLLTSCFDKESYIYNAIGLFNKNSN